MRLYTELYRGIKAEVEICNDLFKGILCLNHMREWTFEAIGLDNFEAKFKKCVDAYIVHRNELYAKWEEERKARDKDDEYVLLDNQPFVQPQKIGSPSDPNTVTVYGCTIPQNTWCKGGDE